jgi:hypothetical protein
MAYFKKKKGKKEKRKEKGFELEVGPLGSAVSHNKNIRKSKTKKSLLRRPPPSTQFLFFPPQPRCLPGFHPLPVAS